MKFVFFNCHKNFLSIFIWIQSRISLLSIHSWIRNFGNCNTLNDLSNKVCVPNKTEDLNLSAFNMITWVITSKILAKDISCKCKLDLMGKKCNSDHW